METGDYQNIVLL